MAFEVWNLATGNVIAEYATEAEALELIHRTAEAHGRQEVAMWGLTEVNDRREERTVAEGEALVERAFAVIAQDRRH
jgi:hypothetical protein